MNENGNTQSYTPEEIPRQAPPPKKKPGFFADLLQFILISIFIVLPIRLFIAQPFIVSGASMEPTFESGNYLIVDQLSYHFEKPSRGTVVIFKYPKDPTKFFIKRIIGLPSETIEINDSKVTIKNDANPEGLVLNEPYIKYPKTDFLSVKLDNDEYFVMGDNRAGSSDSRIWGALSEELIIGRPFIRLLPPSKISFFPGSYNE